MIHFDLQIWSELKCNNFGGQYLTVLQSLDPLRTLCLQKVENFWNEYKKIFAVPHCYTQNPEAACYFFNKFPWDIGRESYNLSPFIVHRVSEP